MRQIPLYCFICLAMTWACAQDLITVSGVGRGEIESARRKRDEAGHVRRATDRAQQEALRRAVGQGILQVFGDESRIRAAGGCMDTLMQLGLPCIKSHQVAAVTREGQEVVVSLSAQVSRNELLSLLETQGISLTEVAESAFRVFVLAYTVEGVDADLSKPVVLREEVHDTRMNVHDEASFSDNTRAESEFSHQEQARENDIHTKSDDRRVVRASAHARRDEVGYVEAEGELDEHVHAEAEESAYAGAAAASDANSAAVKAAYAGRGQVDASHHSSGKFAAGEAHSEESSQSLEAATSLQAEEKQHEASHTLEIQDQASYHRDVEEKASYHDTSTDYHHIKVYADPTKKGAGQTNEVRAVLEGMFNKAGLITSTLDIDLMGRSFDHEDALINLVWDTIRSEYLQVEDQDFIAIALNRTTPIQTSSGVFQFTSAITYRVFRLRDGYQLLPSQSLTAESARLSSADMARAQATKLALVRTGDILQGDLLRALKRYERLKDREETQATTQYTVTVRNVPNPLACRQLQKALEDAGFEVKSRFRAQTVTLDIGLRGKSHDVVLDTLSPLIGDFGFEAMNEHAMVLVMP